MIAEKTIEVYRKVLGHQADRLKLKADG